VTDYVATNTGGQSILSAAAFPRRQFVTTDSLEITADIQENTLFSFKDNSVGLTDIETPTTILVLGGPKQNEIKFQTNKFILQAIVKPLQERFQIIETFGESSLYFYDKRTRIYTLHGVLFDAEAPVQLGSPRRKEDNYWATAFQDFFEKYLRGTVLAQQKWIAAIYVNNWYIKGYPLQLQITKQSEPMPQTVAFQMSWAIKSENLLSSKEAQRLWANNRLSASTMNAYNLYLGASTEYQTACDAYTNTLSGRSTGNLTDLLVAKDKAEKKCREALIAAKLAMKIDANTSGVPIKK
jgi:hypothetical protein